MSEYSKQFTDRVAEHEWLKIQLTKPGGIEQLANNGRRPIFETATVITGKTCSESVLCHIPPTGTTSEDTISCLPGGVYQFLSSEGKSRGCAETIILSLAEAEDLIRRTSKLGPQIQSESPKLIFFTL